jgi:hypothetical protein
MREADRPDPSIVYVLQDLVEQIGAWETLHAVYERESSVPRGERQTCAWAIRQAAAAHRRGKRLQYSRRRDMFVEVPA